MRGLALALVAVSTGATALALTEAVPPITDDNSRPALVAAGDAVHLTWIEGDPGEYTILYAPGDGRSWGRPETVVTDVHVFDLTVLLRPDGTPCVVWTALQLYQSCRAEGAWSVGEIVAEQSYTATYRPAYGPDGHLEILYLEPTTSVFFEGRLLNRADEIVTFPELAVDSQGGLHAFWWDFAPDRGWMWAYSSDGGDHWSEEESLATVLPNAGGTLVGADARGGVHLVLMKANQVLHRQWRAGPGWSQPDFLEFEGGALRGAMALTPEGAITVVGGTSGEGVLSFTRSPGGPWRDRGPVPGTAGGLVDYVATAPAGGGQTLLLWHQAGVVGFNQARVGTESLVEAVPSPGQLNLDPLVVATSLALTAGVVLLIPFPAEMFNNTLAQHHDEILGWLRRRGSRARDSWGSGPGLAAFLVAAALLYGLLDPEFGPRAESIPVFLGLLVGVAVTTLGFALPTMALRRLRAREWGRLRALPLALAAAVACVALSRWIGFLPGYLYGVVLGVSFTRPAQPREEAGEVAVTSVMVLVLSLGAWLALGQVRESSGDGLMATATEAALATTMVAGFEALAIGLLPLGGLPGRVLFQHRRPWWVTIWGLSVLTFFHALINPESGYLVDTALIPALTTVGLLAAFALASLGMWGFFRIRDRGQLR
jgi:hypothetical protein